MNPLRRFSLSCHRVTLLGIALPVFLVGAGLGVLALAIPPGASARPHQASAAPRHHLGPPSLSPQTCPRGAQPLGADAVAVAARVALDAESPHDRPLLVDAALADFPFAASARGAELRHYCGDRVWQRSVVVTIELRRYLPSASLSERVSFVARTRHGYTVYALGH